MQAARLPPAALHMTGFTWQPFQVSCHGQSKELPAVALGELRGLLVVV